MSNVPVSSLKAFLAYSRSIEHDWLFECCAGWYPYNATTEELSPVPPHSIHDQKRAIDGFFITHKVGEVLVKFGKSRLMTISETSSAAEAAGVHIDESVPLHPHNVCEGGDDRGAATEEQICNLRDWSYQYTDGIFALLQIQ